MLKKFALRNYKNFKEDIGIDFERNAGYAFNTDCIVDGIICKMMIYGRNATGKTNLGKAMIDIIFLLFDVPSIEKGFILNADAKESSAIFSYVFQFGDHELIYSYSRFSNFELQNEKMVLDGTIIFECDFEAKKFNFTNLKFIGAETANVDRYKQSLNDKEEMEEIPVPKLPFLRWLISNVAFESDSILFQLIDYVRRMVMITTNSVTAFHRKKAHDNFCELLEKPEKLCDLQDFLNDMGIECRLKLKELPDGQKELYFLHDKLIPFFENASSGTLSLVYLYRTIISRVSEASLVYLDEFDAFYHYDMAENIVRFLKKRYPKCQIIMTSHNTNLMTNRWMRPDCLFILSGTGSLTAFCDATQRELREGHNLEKMYISGEFEEYE